MSKDALAKAAPNDASPTRKELLRQYKQDQRDRDAASGMTVLQARVKDSTKTFLEEYRDGGGFGSIGAALDILVETLEGRTTKKRKQP